MCTWSEMIPLPPTRPEHCFRAKVAETLAIRADGGRYHVADSEIIIGCTPIGAAQVRKDLAHLEADRLQAQAIGDAKAAEKARLSHAGRSPRGFLSISNTRVSYVALAQKWNEIAPLLGDLAVQDKWTRAIDAVASISRDHEIVAQILAGPHSSRSRYLRDLATIDAVVLPWLSARIERQERVASATSAYGDGSEALTRSRSRKERADARRARQIEIRAERRAARGARGERAAHAGQPDFSGPPVVTIGQDPIGGATIREIERSLADIARSERAERLRADQAERAASERAASERAETLFGAADAQAASDRARIADKARLARKPTLPHLADAARIVVRSGILPGHLDLLLALWSLASPRRCAVRRSRRGEIKAWIPLASRQRIPHHHAAAIRSLADLAASLNAPPAGSPRDPWGVPFLSRS